MSQRCGVQLRQFASFVLRTTNSAIIRNKIKSHPCHKGETFFMVVWSFGISYSSFSSYISPLIYCEHSWVFDKSRRFHGFFRLRIVRAFTASTRGSSPARLQRRCLPEQEISQIILGLNLWFCIQNLRDQNKSKLLTLKSASSV